MRWLHQVTHWFARRWEAAGERLADLFAPLEHGVKNFFLGLLHATERLEDVESWFGALLGLLLWPFRMAWRLLVAIGRLLLPAPVRRGLAAVAGWPVAAIRWGLGAVGSAIEWLDLERRLGWLVWLAWPVWRPIAGVCGFVVAWVATRDWRELVWGLPALLLALPLGVLAAQATWLDRGAVAAAYRTSARDAQEAGDYKRAELFERKLSQLGVDTRHSEFNAAIGLAKAGDHQAAYGRMQRLAPEDRPGYARAHSWIVQQVLAGVIDLTPEQRSRVLRVHVNHLDSLGISGVEFDLLRAGLAAQQGELDTAAELLAPHARTVTPAAIELLRVRLAQQDDGAARRIARDLAAMLQQAERQSATLSADEYRWWAVAAQLLEDEEQLTRAVERWAGLAPDDPDAQRIAAELCRQRFERLVGSPAAPPAELVDLLCRAAALGAPGPWIDAQITRLERMRDSAIISTQVPERTLTLLIEHEGAPAALLETLGTRAAVRGDWGAAEPLLARATAADPNNASAWNNLAYVVLELDPARADEALATVEKAIALSPGEYRFRETRGQVYAQLGRWDQAIADLEFALNGMPEAKQIHASLAKAYTALGNQELAAAHRSQAE